MIEIGSAIDPGRKRRTGKNQDALCVLQPDAANGIRPHSLLVIADGMGGYAGGAEASKVVIDCLCDACQQAGPGSEPLWTLQKGINASVATLKKLADDNPVLARMGSTVVAAAITEQLIYLANVGDSRAYIVNESAVRQISYDHSLVAEQVRQGLINSDEARTHPRRNVLLLAISAQHNFVEAFTGVFAWQPGDCLVLCSDGLWGPVPEDQIRAVVLENAPQQAADMLVALANTYQGPDNISVIIARLT